MKFRTLCALHSGSSGGLVIIMPLAQSSISVTKLKYLRQSVKQFQSCVQLKIVTFYDFLCLCMTMMIATSAKSSILALPNLKI